MCLERAGENQELADESIQARQSDRRQHRDDEQRGVKRHCLRDTAVIGEKPRVPPLVQNSDEKEERAGRKAVIHHLQDRAFDRRLIEGEDAEHTEAEVGDGGVGDELFHVGLHPGDKRAVNHADDRQDDHQPRVF